MTRDRPLSYNATLVLQAVLAGHAYGFDVMDATGLPSGIVYPLLRRLEARGLLRSDWERGSEPSELGRPRRRYYRATALAERPLRRAIEHHLERRGYLDRLLEVPPARSERGR